jgi:hypothetical protein
MQLFRTVYKHLYLSHGAVQFMHWHLLSLLVTPQSGSQPDLKETLEPNPKSSSRFDKRQENANSFEQAYELLKTHAHQERRRFIANGVQTRELGYFKPTYVLYL